MKTRHLLPAAALISILCAVSCKKGETVISTYENQVDQKLEQSDSAGVTITQSIEYLESIEGGKALFSKVNNLIVKFCFGDSYDGYELRPASEDYAASLVDDYRKDAGETFDPDMESYWTYNWSYLMTGRFADSYGDLQTYTVYSENYLGGAHGMQSLIPHVIDLRTGEEVLEEEMFVEDYQEPVAGLIREALQKAWGSPDDPSSTYCMMEEEGMVPNGFFGVSEEGVTWYFQPYVIASYAQGVIEAMVPWYLLKPYLSKKVSKF
jgi:hypothetical protein